MYSPTACENLSAMESTRVADRSGDMQENHPPHQEMNLNEKEIFDYLLHPDDSYTSEGVYWADLPLAKRAKFVGNYDAKEAGRELSSIGRMMKADPLSPVGYYFRNMVIPGAGLGLEGFACPAAGFK